MNMKKIKKFFTLSRRAEGFTLVELIVVIAILAILGGVAVPAYSGYVKKANMTADQQLASEVAHALSLAYYSNPNPSEAASGYVVLTTSGASGGGIGKAAMAASFGENWAETATLKYDGWTVNADMLNTALANPNVGNSSYLQNSNVNDLLGNVQTVTNAAAGMLGNLTEDANHYLNILEMTLGEGYMEKAVASGVMKLDENGDYQFASGVTAEGKIGTDLQNQLSNLMVLSVAEEMKGLDSATMSQMMLGGLADGVDNPAGYSDASSMAAKYALFKAYSLENPSAAADFEAMNTALANASGTSDVNAAFTNFYNTHKDGMNGMDPNVFMTNAEAIPAIMKGVSDTSGDYLDSDTLKDSGLYTSGSVASALNAYVAAADLASLNPDLIEQLEIALSDLTTSGGMIVLVAGSNAVIYAVAS